MMPRQIIEGQRLPRATAYRFSFWVAIPRRKSSLRASQCIALSELRRHLRRHWQSNCCAALANAEAA